MNLKNLPDVHANAVLGRILARPHPATPRQATLEDLAEEAAAKAIRGLSEVMLFEHDAKQRAWHFASQATQLDPNSELTDWWMQWFAAAAFLYGMDDDALESLIRAVADLPTFPDT